MLSLKRLILKKTNIFTFITCLCLFFILANINSGEKHDTQHGFCHQVYLTVKPKGRFGNVMGEYATLLALQHMHQVTN